MTHITLTDASLKANQDFTHIFASRFDQLEPIQLASQLSLDNLTIVTNNALTTSNIALTNVQNIATELVDLRISVNNNDYTANTAMTSANTADTKAVAASAAAAAASAAAAAADTKATTAISAATSASSVAASALAAANNVSNTVNTYIDNRGYMTALKHLPPTEIPYSKRLATVKFVSDTLDSKIKQIFEKLKPVFQALITENIVQNAVIEEIYDELQIPFTTI